jgi:hypothetical protein
LCTGKTPKDAKKEKEAATTTVVKGKAHKGDAESERPSKDAAKDKKKVERQMHPIDKFLGAPEPEKKDKPKTKAEKAKEAEDKKKLKPTPSYVFAGIFALLYVIGRFLEAWLVNGLFRKRLHGASHLPAG